LKPVFPINYYFPILNQKKLVSVYHQKAILGKFSGSHPARLAIDLPNATTTGFNHETWAVPYCTFGIGKEY
jgi:hypothetical protein